MDKFSENIKSSSDLHGRFPRFRPRTDIPIRVCSGGNWHDGHILNVSERGAFITLGTEVWKGEEVKLLLELPEAPTGNVELRALTVWRTSDDDKPEIASHDGYGMLFRSDRAADTRLAGLIQKLVDAGRLVPEEDNSGTGS